MKYKRKQKHSKVRCNICAGQRRRFGAGSDYQKTKLKSLDRDLFKDLNSDIKDIVFERN